MNADDPRHGTRAGYDAHRRADDSACEPCTRAAARYENERQIDLNAGRPRLIDATGTRRRIQALAALGHSHRSIAERLGLSHDIVRGWSIRPTIYRRNADRLAKVYDEMSMMLPAAETSAQKVSVSRTRNHAQRQGWPPPLAWDQIDNPNERPTAWQYGVNRTGNNDALIDHVVVNRLVDHRVRARLLTRAEAGEAVRILLSRGVGVGAIEELYGLVVSRYVEGEKEAS